MGGDHKCPVCQATFTRPQHVARHMRSHTGDRPYKCQYCGDQFARSDLLSRHVNKCHANEKPPPGSANSRRKGSASASRATTSKQACDQCVQSSLPCDGCNPCSKCVQRKCRCTFVKFHRQTAPIGPGHNPRPSSSSAPGLPYSHPPSADDFLLGPPPSGTPNPYPHQYSFSYPTSSNTNPTSLLPSDADYAKYRAQSDLIRRTGPNVPQSLYSSSPPWMGWQDQQPQHDQRYLPHIDSPRNLPVDRDLQAALARNYQQTQTYSLPTISADAFASAFSHVNGRSHHQSDHRRESVDFGSDGSASTASVPSSATSSSIHLPLDQQISYHEQSQSRPLANHHFLHQRGTPTNPSPHSESDAHQPPAEGGFSSAFGLMSLDDPNILAGLSTDSAPFFSNLPSGTYDNPADPNATPMPAAGDKGSSNTLTLSTNNKEAETKQLREIWKQYLRTPFSGPGLDTNPISSNSGYRRPRVNSLPSVKTPIAENSRGSVAYNDNNMKSVAGEVMGRNTKGDKTSNAMSTMRTTLHDVDDLKSYEAAVLARQAPTKLNLVPRRMRGASASTDPASSSGSGPTNTTPLPIPPLPLPGIVGTSRPSSSSSSSSLAGAFGPVPSYSQRGQSHGSSNPPPHSQSPALMAYQQSSSRESSSSLEDGDGNRPRVRPSFKRLASQTLGPSSAKRANLDVGEDGGRQHPTEGTGIRFDETALGDNGKYISRYQSSGGIHLLPPPQSHAGMYARSGMPTPAPGESRERKRRMSAPSTSPTAGTFTAAGQL